MKTVVLTHRPPDFSLLETMRWSPAEGIDRWELHLERLSASADYFSFPLPDGLGASLSSIAGEKDQRVRLLLSRTGEVSVEVTPLESAVGSVCLAIDTEPVDGGNVMLFHKTTHRAVYDEAAARHPGADDVVLVNEAGLATETTRANLAVRFGGLWVTPPIGDGCLPGTYRAELVAAGTLQEQSVPAAALAEADDLAVLSSLRGWRPAD